MNRGTAAFVLQATLISVLSGSNAVAADLMEVLQAAKGHDPEYLAARSDQSAGEARRSMGDTLLKPSVNLVASAGVIKQSSTISGAQFSTPAFGTFNNANFNTSINSGTQTRVAIQATQPLYDRELSAQKDQLQLSAGVTDMGVVAADQTLILRVAENYFEAVKTQAIIELLVEQQKAVSNTHSEISKRQHLGDASRIDLQLTAEQVEATKAKLLNAQLAYQNDLLMLTELTGQNIKVIHDYSWFIDQLVYLDFRSPSGRWRSELGSLSYSLTSWCRSDRTRRHRRSASFCALGPAAEHLVDGDQFELGELLLVFLGHLGIGRTIEVLRGDFLAFGGVQVLQVSLGHFARAVLVHVLVHDGDRRLSQDAHATGTRCRTCLRRIPSSPDRLRFPR